MHIHILGICGTFMGGIAAIAREAGHTVTGCDANVYPPMSTQLESLGIELMEGFKPEHIDQVQPDVVIVGNVVSRGNPAMEYVLEQGLPYTSGPQWLSENILQQQHVLAVAGTHGKTTTSSMLAWILEDAGLEPGFLIGGVTGNFPVSARLGAGKFFVIEADEYDTAFFDKRSKFVHYRPKTAILNNLEFDHADIFDDLAAIQKQFHHLIRTIPGGSVGRILVNAHDENLQDTIELGCWSEQQTFGTSKGDWSLQNKTADGRQFTVCNSQQALGTVEWEMLGEHNQLNALAAIGAAEHVGVNPTTAITALGKFAGIKRRMELRGVVRGVTVYDDFAHHPTAIATTVAGLRANVGQQRIIAILEPRSNTMQMGIHKDTLAESLSKANKVLILVPPGSEHTISMNISHADFTSYPSVDAIVDALMQADDSPKDGDHILIMSNGGFGGIHQCILERLAT